MSHRTVWCASGATTTSRATVDCKRIQCATVRARVRAASEGTLDSVQWLSGAPPDCPVAQKTEANGRVTWLAHWTVSGGAPDCPVRHATDSLPTTTFGGWGYKYPNHPTFNGIQVFHLQHLTRAIAFNSRHNQRDQILSQVRNHSKSNSD